MNYKIESLEDSAIVYMRNVGAYGSLANFKQMSYFKEWIIQNDLLEEVNTHGILGVALDNPKKTPQEKCRYDLILCVSNNKNYDSQVRKGHFVGGTYAVFTVPHTMEAVQHFWTNLGNTLSQNKFDIPEKPIIERFKEEHGNCEFLVPIR